MNELSPKARIFVIGTILVGSGLLIRYLLDLDIDKIWPTLVMAGIASLALIFKVVGTTNRSHYNISFLIYAASFFLLGTSETIVVILISNLVEWIWHKYPWYIQSFNIGCYIITIHVTSLVFNWTNPDKILFTWLGALTMLVAMITFTMVNHLMVGMIVWLARGESFKQSGVFDSLPLMIDFTLLSMGAGVALIWTLDPIAIVFVIIPLYLIYSTLRVPALERQTEIDQKTGVFNHQYFEKALESELSRANRFDHPLTVVMADLDLLRNINNTYGHLAGDEVLIGVANILKKHTREYDIVARFGGEEFSLLFPETTVDAGFEIVERIRKEIENEGFTVPTSVTPIKVTMSFGIAGRSRDAQTSKELIHNADTAVYHSKLRGRNRTHIYADQIYQGLFQPSIPVEHPVDLHHKPTSSHTTLPSQDPQTGPQTLPIKPLVAKPDPNPAVNPRPVWQINLFILGIALAAASLLLALDPPPQNLHLVSLFAFMGIVFLAEWFSVDIYVRNTSVSTSAAPILAGIILFGTHGAVLLSLAFAFAAFLKHRSPFSRFAFNFSNQLLGTMICIAFIQGTGLDFTTQNHLVQLTLTLLLGMILYFSTTFMVSAAMHLSLGNPLRQIWREHFSWLAAYYLVMGMIAYTLLFSYAYAGLIGTMIVAAPLALLRLSQKQYLDRTRAMVNELREKNVILERSSSEISTLNEGLLKTLAEVVDLRDPFVLGHSQQVTLYAVQIAEKMGLDKDRIEIIRQASLLHDIGKLGIPEQILLKPARLTPQEYSIVKEHVTLGAEILEASPSLHELIPIVRHHHERYDGTGYPDKLKGESIPIEARIVAVADAIEAMASDRPYRRAMELDQILEELRNYNGTQFDPQVIQAFEEIAADEGISLVVNSARQDINLRLHTDLDEVYHHLLKKKSIDPEQESVAVSRQPIGGVALDFSFTTLPGNR